MSERVAVVVVAYNSAEVLPQCLESLPAGLAGVDWHCYVVDNASRDASVQVAQEAAATLPVSVVATGRNGGYAAGINAGAAQAGEWSALLVLNPDVRLGPGCGARLLAELADERVGIAVPRLSDAHGDLIASQRREPTVLRMAADAFIGADRAGRWGTLGEVVTDPARYEHSCDVDWAEGSTVLVSRRAWQRVGAWDDSYFLYSEETEFALRVRDSGLRVRYVADAEAVHLEGGSATSVALWPLLVVNRWKLFRARHSAPAAALYWVLLMAREASRALLGKATSRAAVRALLSRRWLLGPRGPQLITRTGEPGS